MTKRETWRAKDKASLIAQGVNMIELNRGAVRVLGQYADITVTDLADITEQELGRLNHTRMIDRNEHRPTANN